MNRRVSLSIEDHLALVMLDRPDKRNAVDLEMFASLAAVTAKISHDRSVRAVVLYGSGSDFCAGIDISVFSGPGVGASIGELMQSRTPSGANFFQQAAMGWRELPVPVIAALHGTVYGAGLQIALGADLRLAAQDTRLSVMEIKWGLIPDMAISVTLSGILAEDKARELCYTGRIVTADEALDLGLVTRLCADPLADAKALAAEIAGKSPDAVRAIKCLINESWQANRPASLRLEAELQTRVMAGSNQREAVAANLEKRQPTFRNAGD